MGYTVVCFPEKATALLPVALLSRAAHPLMVKDSIVRGRVLELLFERRNDDPVLFGGAAGAVPAPPGIDPSDWLRAVAQLAESGLIDWKPLKKETRGATMAGLAKITDAGMIALKGGESGPLKIRFPGDAAP